MTDVKIRAHWDADGITAGYFTTFGVPDSELEIAIYEDGFGTTKNLTKNDYIVDMRPQDMEWDGICIDHHLPHPEERKYTLHGGEVPATLLAFNMYKDKIPKSEWWKIAIGLMGDGQPELIPTEVFETCPYLLKYVKTSAYQSYGKWNFGKYPVYKLLSSYINAFLRKGEYESAIQLLKYSDHPRTIMTSTDALAAKSDVKNDFVSAIKDCEIIHYDNLAVVLFYSRYRMSGYVSSSLLSHLDNKTVMAINTRNGSLSLRGDLSYYYRDTLKSLDYLTIDGHPGFCGGKLTDKVRRLVSDLDEIL